MFALTRNVAKLSGRVVLRATDMSPPGECNIIGFVDIRKTGTAREQKCDEEKIGGLGVTMTGRSIFHTEQQHCAVI